MRSSEPSLSSAAAKKNAAEEMSDGTRKVCPTSHGRPSSITFSPSTLMFAPNFASAISEWSRVFSFSVTDVSPSAYMPPNSTAVFTWALATGG